jgi:hypothetical protein
MKKVEGVFEDLSSHITASCVKLWRPSLANPPEHHLSYAASHKTSTTYRLGVVKQDPEV